MIKRFSRQIGGKKVIIELIKSEDLDLSEINPVTQISGICYDKQGNILILSSKPNKWFIPGGKPEAEESFEETLRREVYEEATVEVENILPLAFLKIKFPDNPNKTEGDLFFQGRFLAEVKNICPIKKDPATGVLFERKFIPHEDFPKYVKWDDAEDLIFLMKRRMSDE